MTKIFLLAKNTVEEMIRQPIYLILFLGTGATIFLSPFYTLFGINETKRLLVEIGLASISLTSLVLVSTASSFSMYNEIKNKTVLVVVTKPVSRLEFIIGKYVGIISCAGLAIVFHAILVFYVFRMGAPETTAYKVDQPVFLSVSLVYLVSLGYGLYQSYFLQKSFGASVIKLAIVLQLFFFIFVGIFNYKWEIQSYWEKFDSELFKATMLIFLAVFILGSFSMFLSLFFNRDMNLLLTFCFFVLGLMSDVFAEEVLNAPELVKMVVQLVPNFHFFQLADAVNFQRHIQWSYIAYTFLYAFLFQAGVFVLSYSFFDRRELS